MPADDVPELVVKVSVGDEAAEEEVLVLPGIDVDEAVEKLIELDVAVSREVVEKAVGVENVELVVALKLAEELDVLKDVLVEAVPVEPVPLVEDAEVVAIVAGVVLADVVVDVLADTLAVVLDTVVPVVETDTELEEIEALVVLVGAILAALLVVVPLDDEDEAEDDVDKLVDVVAANVPEDEVVGLVLTGEVVDGGDAMLVLVVVIPAEVVELVSATVLVVVVIAADGETLADVLPLVVLAETALLVGAVLAETELLADAVLTETELVVDTVLAGAPRLLVEIEPPIDVVEVTTDGVEVNPPVDVLPPTFVVERRVLEIEGITDEVDVPPIEVVGELLVPSTVLDREDAVVVGAFVAPVVVACEALPVVVVAAGGLAELEVCELAPVVVVAPGELVVTATEDVVMLIPAEVLCVVIAPCELVVGATEDAVVLVPGGMLCVVVVVEAAGELVLLATDGTVLEVGGEVNELGGDCTVPELVVVGITTAVVLDPLVIPGDVA